MIVVVFAGLKSIAMLLVGLAGAVVSLTSAYFFLSRRGLLRWLSFGLFVLAPIAVLVVYAVKSLLWVAILSAAVWFLATVASARPWR